MVYNRPHRPHLRGGNGYNPSRFRKKTQRIFLMPPQNRFAPLLCAALAALAGGCFEHAAPRRDVTAFSPAEAASLRETATFLDYSLAQDLQAFPDDLGSFPALRRVSVRGQKAAAEVPASIAAAKSPSWPSGGTTR